MMGGLVRIRPGPFALVGTPAGWIRRVKVRRAFFPPRCGTARRPQRPSHASHRSGRSRSGDLEYAAAGYGAVSVTAPARGRGGLSARPWQFRGVAALASLVVAASFRRPSRQQGIVAITGPTAVCRKIPLGTEHAPFGVPTVGAYEPTWVEVTFQPNRANAVIQKLGDWEVYHAAIIPYSARWLHMSRPFNPCALGILRLIGCRLLPLPGGL
jgi:hypothetical protein